MRAVIRPVLVLSVLLATGCGGGGNVFALSAGDCFEPAEDTGAEITDVTVVDCADEHGAEVYATFELDGEDFPGADDVDGMATAGCLERFEDFVGLPYAQSRFLQSSYVPSEASWADGDREVVCFLVDIDGAPLTGSAEGLAE